MNKLFIIALCSMGPLLGIPYYMAAMKSEDRESMQKEIDAVREKNKKIYEKYEQDVKNISRENSVAQEALEDKYDPEWKIHRSQIKKIEDEIAAIDKNHPNAMTNLEKTDEEEKAEEQIEDLYEKISELEEKHDHNLLKNSDYQREKDALSKQYEGKINKNIEENIEFKKAAEEVDAIAKKYADKVRNESDYNRKIMGDK